MVTHILVRMYPDIAPIPPERTKDFLLFRCCPAACIQDVQCVVRMAREDDVVKLKRFIISLSQVSTCLCPKRQHVPAMRGAATQLAT